MTIQSAETVARLLSALRAEDREAAWLEFKTNMAVPEQIGQYVSALANGAALDGRTHGYLVWGVRDGDHDVVGTKVVPPALKKGNEDLEPWITRLLSPHVAFDFIRAGTTEEPVWLMRVAAATSQPVAFAGVKYIRVGSAKKPLEKHPELERRLWRAFERDAFETASAIDKLDESEALDLLDYPGYFRLTGTPLPESRQSIVEALQRDGIISRATVGWSVTNLGAALFARDLRAFPDLSRKTVRVVQYRGNGRTETTREREHVSGYAVGFEQVIDNIQDLLPRNEVIGRAFRTEESMFPEIALRELVANMVVHQDFSERGSGPMVEIFDGRMEITNPGRPIIDARRFVDHPPKSRNEDIAAMMRRCHLAEERGSGWDKVAAQTELFQLPAPRIETTEFHTRAVLFAHKPLAQMNRDDRIRSVYLHACLRQVLGETTTNSSVRERFDIDAENTAQASRLLKEAVDAGVIGLYDPTAGYRARRYLPYWALPNGEPADVV